MRSFHFDEGKSVPQNQDMKMQKRGRDVKNERSPRQNRKSQLNYKGVHNKRNSIQSNSSRSSSHFSNTVSNEALKSTTDLANRFNPLKHMNEIIGNFQVPFTRLLDYCGNKWCLQLVHICKQEYKQLKETLLHSNQHLSSPYFNVLHENSTDTKIHLLQMLAKQERKVKQHQSQLKEADMEIQTLNKEMQKLLKVCKSKDDLYIKEATQGKKYLQKLQQFEQATTNLKDQCQKLMKKQQKAQFELTAKQAKLKQLQQNKKYFSEQLELLQQQIQSIKQNKNPITPRLIKQPKLTNNSLRSQTPESKKSEILSDQDFYRFLFIQAITIEENVVSQQ